MSDDVVRALLGAFPLVVPEMVLGAAACVLFVGGAFRQSRHLWGAVALIDLAGAALALEMTWPAPGVHTAGSPKPDYVAPVTLDGLALAVKVLAIAGGALLALVSWDELPDRQAAEYHGCLLVIVAGLCLAGSANELVTLFLALELVSIPTYVLLYLPRHDAPAQEAAMKYFLLSVFASALFLFGVSYLYGLGGTTNIPAIREALGRPEEAGPPAVAVVALVMVVAGLGFRITAVPFHFYAPDVYQGAPTGAAALLAFLPKVAGFGALLRVLGLSLVPEAGVPVLGQQVPILFWILAAVTMSLGNVLALLQTNVKRLLAYSSVAHAGYMLIGLAVAQPLAVSAAPAVLFYLAAYGAMTIGAFAVLVYLSTPGRPVEAEDDLAGLSRNHPGIAFLMAIFLFSLIGIPLTGGFVGKLMLFMQAVKVEGLNARLFQWLALIGALNAAVGGWYYLRILGKMYLQNPVKPLEPPRRWAGLAALTACAAVTLVLGMYPQAVLPGRGFLPSEVGMKKDEGRAQYRMSNTEYRISKFKSERGR